MNITSGFGSWNSSSTVSSSGFGDWQTRFPKDNQTGTENPTNEAEKRQRIAHLEQKIYELRNLMREADRMVDNARNKVTTLENRVNEMNSKAREAEGRYNRLNNEQGRLEGRQIAIRNKRHQIKEKLNNPAYKDEWGWLSSELSSLENERWQVVDELGRVTDQKMKANEQMHDYYGKAREADFELSSARNEVDSKIRDLDARKQQLAHHENELSNLKYS